MSAITIVVVRVAVSSCVARGHCAFLQWGSLIWFQQAYPAPYEQVWAFGLLAVVGGYVGALFTSFNTWVCLVRKRWSGWFSFRVAEVCALSVVTSVVFFALPLAGHCHACDTQDPTHCVKGAARCVCGCWVCVSVVGVGVCCGWAVDPTHCVKGALRWCGCGGGGGWGASGRIVLHHTHTSHASARRPPPPHSATPAPNAHARTHTHTPAQTHTHARTHTALLLGSTMFRTFQGYRCHEGTYNDLAVLSFNPQGFTIQALFVAPPGTFRVESLLLFRCVGVCGVCVL